MKFTCDTGSLSADKQLPVELWLEIVYHSLADLPLFSTDPLNRDPTYGVFREDWESATDFQLQRNNLRLVCHTWKHFVDNDKIKHLQVKLKAHFNSEMEKDSNYQKIWNYMKHSRRLEGIAFLREDSKDYREGMAKDYAEFSPLILALKRRVQFSNVQILGRMDRRGMDELIRVQSLFPNLQTIHIDFQYDPDTTPLFPYPLLVELAERYPQLICLDLQIGSHRVAMDEENKVLSMPNLKSLSLISNTPLLNLHLSTWNLESLTYLELSPLLELKPLFETLPILGKNLTTLRVMSTKSYYFSRATYPWAKLWAHCPFLKYLGFPLLPLLEHPPPLDHPVRYIINLRKLTGVHDELRLIPVDTLLGRLSAFCGQAKNLRVLADVHEWPPFVPGLREGKADAPTLVRMANVLAGIDIRFEDKFKKTLVETIEGQ